ncbi:PHP domain-containing protein [Hominifimenecus sp. rT4P-3]|uniref:PHP domain-containing protein n=1 Tax=Hominifimenecus sp. rT4P-3 TaxID=3242979 RepID=UPI003DA1D424
MDEYVRPAKEEKRVDLHAHTTCSDGTISPGELIHLAKKKGLSAVAVTDHDTTAGLTAAMAEGARIGMEVIPGIEFSTNLEEREIHIIGLFLRPECPSLQASLQRMRETRNERNRASIQKLADAGFSVSMEDLKRYGDEAILTRGHIGKLLVDRGYAPDVKTAIRTYLIRGCAGYVRRMTPPPAEAILRIHEAGGLAFVAHPHQIYRDSPEDSLRVCRLILEQGADGLETRYSEYDGWWKEKTEALAREFSCLRSGGSDFHGTLKKGLELGCGYGDLLVPYSFLDKMREAL